MKCENRLFLLYNQHFMLTISLAGTPQTIRFCSYKNDLISFFIRIQLHMQNIQCSSLLYVDCVYSLAVGR